MTDEFASLTPEELRLLADGCTECTCPYHGRYNLRLIDLGEPRR